MSETVEQIVHESEAQRQFVRVHLPAQVEFEGAIHNVRDLSTGGIGILNVEKSYAKGSIVEFKLVLPFGEFSLDISLEGQVQYYNAENKVLGARFANLSKQQISLLNHVIKSFISGDVVASGDILNVVGRDNFVRVRKQGDTGQNNAPSVLRQAMPLFFIALLGVIATLFVGSNIFENMFMVKAETAVVEADSVTVDSTAAGRFQAATAVSGTTAKVGDVLGTIYPVGGAAAVKVTSPCNCYVYRSIVKDGQTVAANAPIAALVPVTSHPTVAVRMTPAEAQNLKMSNMVTISVAGSELEQTTGQITEIQSSLASQSADPVAALQPPYVTVKIRPDTKLPVDLTGRPAQVRFKTY